MTTRRRAMAGVGPGFILLLCSACSPPGPDQPKGEACNMALAELRRCGPGLYCREAGFTFRLTHAAGAEVGHCTKRLAAGEACINKDADCETWLVCDQQSGVCRSRSEIHGANMRNDVVRD